MTLTLLASLSCPQLSHHWAGKIEIKVIHFWALALYARNCKTERAHKHTLIEEIMSVVANSSQQPLAELVCAGLSILLCSLCRGLRKAGPVCLLPTGSPQSASATR